MSDYLQRLEEKLARARIGVADAEKMVESASSDSKRLEEAFNVALLLLKDAESKREDAVAAFRLAEESLAQAYQLAEESLAQAYQHREACGRVVSAADSRRAVELELCDAANRACVDAESAVEEAVAALEARRSSVAKFEEKITAEKQRRGVAKGRKDKAESAAAYAPSKKPPSPPPNTHNGRLIWSTMKDSRITGNPRDYVLLAGARLLDWSGSWDVTRAEDGKSVGVNGIALVHKRDLHAIVGDEVAARFWHKSLGVRVAFPNS